MTGQEQTLTSAVGSMAEALKGLAAGGAGAGPSACFELAAAEGPYEEVIICRSLGTATVYIKGTDLYIVPNGKLHELNCRNLGTYVGVFKAGIGDDLFTFPPAPKPPFDQPSDIPDFRDKLHVTKAIWNLPDGSIEGVGPANSYVVPLRDGSAQLVISIAMVITGGTRRYEGALGTISSLGATWFPYNPALDLKNALRNGAIYEAKGVHGFRITRKEFQK